MIGLTAGLVIEGHTGKSILEQVKSASIDCIQFRALCSGHFDQYLWTFIAFYYQFD